MKIYPNAYYNYRKHRKAVQTDNLEQIKEKITKIYHNHHGVPGHRMMKAYLAKDGIILSKTSVHKYMNKLLGLKSVVRRANPNYHHGKKNNVFNNELAQEFKATRPNEKWCTDFTYIYLSNGTMRYNCTIIDLYDRSAVATMCDDSITSSLAIRTLEKAIENHDIKYGELLLHSDQGSQFTSNEFVKFCPKHGIKQSMSKAGYPYDNAPMERFFNTVKNECIYFYTFKTEKQLYDTINWYINVEYNYSRPHSYNGYITPMQARRQYVKV